MRPSALYICYYNIGEPLVQSQVVSYVRELAAGGQAMHLLTFEPVAPGREERRRISADLARAGIRWHWLRYHKRPSLPATLYDIAVGTVVSAWLCLRHSIRLVHARSHVSGAMGLLLKWALRRTLLFDFRGQLAEEYADAGHWARTSAAYRLTTAAERLIVRQADGIVVLTEKMKTRLLDGSFGAERPPEISVIPCCVDTLGYAGCRELRERYRQERGWAGRSVLLYLGKLSSRYMPQEIARFVACALRSDPSFFFQVVTQGDAHELIERLDAQGIDPRRRDVRYVAPADIPMVLAAADATISFIGGEASKQAVSPTKVGESWAAGVPVVSTRGVGDLDAIIRENKLGVIVGEFTDDGMRHSLADLRALLDDRQLAARCRDFVDRELSLRAVGGPRYARLYAHLQGHTPAEGTIGGTR